MPINFAAAISNKGKNLSIVSTFENLQLILTTVQEFQNDELHQKLARYLVGFKASIVSLIDTILNLRSKVL